MNEKEVSLSSIRKWKDWQLSNDPPYNSHYLEFPCEYKAGGSDWNLMLNWGGIYWSNSNDGNTLKKNNEEQMEKQKDTKKQTLTSGHFLLKSNTFSLIAWWEENHWTLSQNGMKGRLMGNVLTWVLPTKRRIGTRKNAGTIINRMVWSMTTDYSFSRTNRAYFKTRLWLRIPIVNLRRSIPGLAAPFRNTLG